LPQTLADFVIQLMREGRYGDPLVTDDSPTQDIIRLTNDYCFKLWRAWDWHWSVEIEEWTQAAGSADKTLSADVGDILAVDAGADDYLQKVSLKEYLRWQKRANESGGTPRRYIKRGRDADGNFRIRLHPAPASATSMSAWYKKRLTRYTVADIATNTGMLFFPEEVLDVIRTGVQAGIAKIQGDKVEASTKRAEFKEDLAALIQEEESEADEEIQAPPPAAYRRRRRARGGSSVH
jgi:hypothetical protein